MADDYETREVRQTISELEAEVSEAIGVVGKHATVDFASLVAMLWNNFGISLSLHTPLNGTNFQAQLMPGADFTVVAFASSPSCAVCAALVAFISEPRQPGGKMITVLWKAAE